jgi:hypothetical protein
LIGKLDLLTRGLHMNLDSDQRTKLAAAMEVIDKDDEMSEEAAKEHLDAINAVLTAEHSELLTSIELPRPARPSGAANGGPRVVARGADSTGPGPQPAGGSGAGGGPPSTDNPFKQEENAKRLNQLRERISAGQ